MGFRRTSAIHSRSGCVYPRERLPTVHRLSDYHRFTSIKDAHRNNQNLHPAAQGMSLHFRDPVASLAVRCTVHQLQLGTFQLRKGLQPTTSFFNTSPALNEQCSKPILIILMISYRGYANVILSKSIQYNGDYKQLQKRSEPHTILCFVPEIHGINQTNGAIAGHSLSSFQQGPVTFHAIHVSWPAWLHPAKRHWDIRDIPKEWIKRGQRNGEKLERTRICRNLSTISGQRRTSGSAQLDLLYHIKASILIVLVVANFDRYYDYNQIVQKSLVWGGNHVKSKLYRSKLGSRKLMYHVFKYILIQIS